MAGPRPTEGGKQPHPATADTLRTLARGRALPDHLDAVDVIVVGGSVAGCATATLLARQGLTVCVVERRPDPAVHKVLCTHNIQPCAVPILQQLGVDEAMESRGARRTRVALHTRYGWMRDPRPEHQGHHGYNVRRDVIDPAVRIACLKTDGVYWLGSHKVEGLLGEPVRGVQMRHIDGVERTLRARLVVAADGRDSPLAELAQVPTQVLPHGRFVYWAWYEGLEDWGSESRLWFQDPQCAYAFPNDGATIVACFITLDQLDAWKQDVEGHFLRHIDQLPGGPDLSVGRRVSRFLGALDMTNRYRAVAHRGMALVGDAACCGDPLWGIGVGWALQAAKWLSEEVGPALLHGDDLAAALVRYRRHHRRQIYPHWQITSDYANGRPFNLMERLLFRAAVADPYVARHTVDVGARLVPPYKPLLDPFFVARLLWANSTATRSVHTDSRGAVAQVAPPT